MFHINKHLKEKKILTLVLRGNALIPISIKSKF